LIVLAEQFGEKHWKEISKRFVNKNSLQCFSRYKRIRPGIVKGSWKKDEDFRILELVRKYGKSWSKISKILGTRNGKQIRDRFINILDPEIRKGRFTEEEDMKLISLFQQHGSKWATIAKFYPNRTADMVKNRFHSSLKKKMENSCLEFTNNYEMTIAEYKEKSESSEKLSSPTKNSTFEATQPINNMEMSDKYFSNESSPIRNLYENMDNKNYESSIISNFSNYDFYANQNNNINVDFFSAVNAGFKLEETMFLKNNNTLNWNFEDYFTI